MKDAVTLLSNMDNAARIMAICADIDRLESDADHVMRAAMSKLFRDEPDVRELIKLQADLRTSGNDHRPLRRRRQYHSGHRARELLIAPIGRAVISLSTRITRHTTLGMSIDVLVLAHTALRWLFDFMNGFHDAANSIATVVSTGVLQAAIRRWCWPPSSTSSRSSSST